MTDTEKTELFAALAALTDLYPHWRVGQLISNVAGWADVDIWNVEDHQLLSASREHLGGASPVDSIVHPKAFELNGAKRSPDVIK